MVRLGKPPIECICEVTKDKDKGILNNGDVLSGYLNIKDGVLDLSWDNLPEQLPVEGILILPTVQSCTEMHSVR